MAETPGWPNQPYIKAMSFFCGVALRNYQLPYIPVPDGMQLLLRGWWANGGVIYVTAESSLVNNINSSFPMLANEVVALWVKNAENIYVSATVAGEGLSMITEYASKNG